MNSFPWTILQSLDGYFSKHRFLMPSGVTLQVHCHRETGNMGWKDLSVNRQGGGPATKALWANA